MMRYITLTLLFLSGIVTRAQQAIQAVRAQRPNIIFIISDDHAYQAISAYGSKLAETPNIDRIARGGALFTQTLVTNSICGPSRACLLTDEECLWASGVCFGCRFVEEAVSCVDRGV